MAKVHTLTQPKSGLVNAAIHFTTPVGSNAAGVLWRDVLEATGLLGVHGDYYDVDAAEVLAIEAGDVMEITALLHDSGAGTMARKAALEAEADKAIATWQQRYSRRHDYYSMSFGTVS